MVGIVLMMNESKLSPVSLKDPVRKAYQCYAGLEFEHQSGAVFHARLVRD